MLCNAYKNLIMFHATRYTWIGLMARRVLREIAEKQVEERGGKQHDTTPEPTVTHKEQRKAKDNAENQLLPFVQSPPDRRQRTSK